MNPALRNISSDVLFLVYLAVPNVDFDFFFDPDVASERALKCPGEGTFGYLLFS